jgi:arginyl-tRNA synthetase
MLDSAAPVNASPSGDLQAEIVRVLRDTIHSLGYNAEGLDLTLRPIPLEGEWGFGSAVAFQLKRNGAPGTPQEIAQRVADAVPLLASGHSLPQLERVEAVNSYVNFYADKDWYANRVVNQVLSQGPDYGCWPDRGERVMVEYANLNTHKAMHVGHLRNVVLGAAVTNILKCAGFDTVAATYLGDIGMHVMRGLWGYLNFFKGQEPDTDRGNWLETIYVDATARLDYRKNVTELISEAAERSPAISGQLFTALQALMINLADPIKHLPHIIQLAEPGVWPRAPWDVLLKEVPYIVFDLWDELGQMLVAQPSELETTNRDAAPISELSSGADAQALSDLRQDYEKLDAHRDWWDQVPRWQDEIKEYFARWEAQDPDLVALWERTRQWSLDMFERIFGDLGIHFDVWFFESEVEHPGKEVVDELIQLGIAEDLRLQGGPVIVRVDDQLRAHPELSKKYHKELFKTNKDGTEEPREAWRVLVVLRSDGTSLYATKDLELARRKFDNWHIDRAIYVVDTAQSLYFQQIFKVLELWGFPQAEKCFHLAYERVNTPEGSISSRRGGAPQYESFEREALRRARAVVEAKEADPSLRSGSRNLTEDQKGMIARAVAYGAIKMGMLDKDNNKVITFEWEQALNPESQSATYVQYSHARATRVLEKAPPELWPEEGRHYNFSSLTVYETNLLEMIAKLPEEVARAAESYKPVIIATYCFELADSFNAFYHNCPVLKAGSEERVRARLALTAASKQTLANALGLLGIEAPDMM